MKIKCTRLAACSLFLILQACSNDIELFRPDQAKTYVVFGLLNSTDPLQQVKVRMTSVTDASIGNIEADSNEFITDSSLQVVIQEWHHDNYALYALERVRYPKEPGIFFNVRNDLFETKLVPHTDMDYKLIITNPDNGDIVESKISPVPAPKLGAPTWSWIRYNFSLESDPFNIRYYEVPRGHVYLVRFTIRYINVMTIGDTLYSEGYWAFPPRFVDDPPEYSSNHESYGNEHNQHMSKEYTYRVFENVVPVIDGLAYRELICFEVAVWAGDENLRNYTEFGLKFNDNRKQVFTNINNGIGFFGGCSHTDCTGILPDQDFMDFLPIHSRTRALKFRTTLYRPGALPPGPNARIFPSMQKNIRYEE
jgi:hypothetical protein